LAAVSLRNSRTLNSLEEKEKKLQEAHDVLEDRVKERTCDLIRANEQLMAEMEERRRAVEALQKSEEKYRVVADNTYDWEFWVDPNDAYIYVSPACERITGHSRRDFETNPDLMTQLLHPEDLPRYQAHRHTAKRNPESEGVTFRIRRPDGQERWIEHLCQPVFDRKGRFLGNRGSNRDITAKKLAEEQTLQNKKRLQVVFDGISEPLTFVDVNMTIQMVNMAAVRYYQMVSPQDVIGRSTCGEFGVKKDLCERCPIPSAVSGGKQVSFVREGYMDPERLESVTIFPVLAENEGLSGAVIRIADITDARMMENALLRNQKLASIGVLSSGIAHEINNPNNFIMFNVPVLRRYLGAILPIVKSHAAAHADFKLFGMSFEAFERDLFELADSIEKGSERIKNIVSELKEFSSLGDQREAAWRNPEQTIAQAVRFSRNHLKERVKRLDVDIPEDLPDTFFEARGLEQVIVNLLINAAQAADKENSWVRLKVAVEGQETRYLVILIKDNGCGIDEKGMAMIFDPFYTTKAPGVGTGLGLYVSHNLIEKVGGSIRVNSRVEHGSTFRIMLLCK
jgi:PAS domain S-box-containing protein